MSRLLCLPWGLLSWLYIRAQGSLPSLLAVLLFTSQHCAWEHSVNSHGWQVARVLLLSVLYHTQDKVGGRRRKCGTFGLMVFVFPSNPSPWWGPALLKEHLSAHGKHWIVLLCLCERLLLSQLNYLAQCMSSPANFTLLILSPVPLEWTE